MENQPKLNLVYIASIGRSGTTLLECILGAHSQITTCGEVQIWPHEIMQGGVLPCGSGKYVHEDPFWTEMRRRVDPLKQPEPQIHFFREQHNAGRTLRLERLRDFGKQQLSEDVAKQVQQYSQNNYDMFSTFLDIIEETTGVRPRWVVDASKDPYRLLWFIRSNLFNIKVFHLVKNPRGFVYSVTKRWLNSDDRFRNQKRLYYTARQSLAWVIQNHLSSKIAETHLDADNYRLIQYEELASNPKETFRDVCKVIGCRYEEQAMDNFRAGGLFAIAGNPMRQETRDIELDQKWQKCLPRSSRRVTELVTKVNRSRFGYS